jgi:hypothetical protein
MNGKVSGKIADRPFACYSWRFTVYPLSNHRVRASPPSRTPSRARRQVQQGRPRRGGGGGAWAKVPDMAVRGALQSTSLCVAGRFGRVVVIGSGYHDGDQTVYIRREEAGKGHVLDMRIATTGVLQTCASLLLVKSEVCMSTLLLSLLTVVYSKSREMLMTTLDVFVRS